MSEEKLRLIPEGGGEPVEFDIRFAPFSSIISEADQQEEIPVL